jgi:uncharacterized protein (TIGR03437 family)
MLFQAVLFAFVMCGAAFGTPGFYVQQLIQVPLQPAQSINSLTMDAGGNMIVTGSNGKGGFVSKLDPSGNPVFSLVNFGAYPAGAAVDTNGDVYWIGRGGAPGFVFPFTKTILPASNTGSATPGFVVKFHGVDGTILWAAELEALQPEAITVDSSGLVIVAGAATTAPGFTTPGAYQSPEETASPMGIARLTADGDAVFMATYGGNTVNGVSTCVSTPFSECLSNPRTGAASVLLDSQGHIWVAGSTNEIDLPLSSNALKTTCGCSLHSGDGYLAEFSADGSSLLYATYLGTSTRSSSDQSGNDTITSAAMDSSGKIWLAGATNGTDLPVTSDAAQSSLMGDQDGFVLVYDPAANKLVYGTYFGSEGTNSITKLAIDPTGAPVFSGILDSNAADPYSFGYDFVGVFNSSGIDVTPFLRYGADGGLAFSPSGDITVAGSGSVIAQLAAGSPTSPSVFGITNSASFSANGQVSPGEIISITGLNLGPDTATTASLSAGQQILPSSLGGVQVLFDGVATPLLYVSSTQINAIVPFGIADQPETTMVVKNASGSSNHALLGVVSAVPGIFVTGSAYQNLPVAAALNQDGSINSPSNRAAPGSIVSVFATGFGALTPQPQDGSLLIGSLPTLQQTVGVFTSDIANVLYAGPVPGQVAGAMQVNFQLPEALSQTPTILLFAGPWPSSYFTVWVSGT